MFSAQKRSAAGFLRLCLTFKQHYMLFAGKTSVLPQSLIAIFHQSLSSLRDHQKTNLFISSKYRDIAMQS